MKVLVSLVLILVFTDMGLTAQEETKENARKYIIESYISNLQSVITDSLKGNWISDNLIHNRLSFTWNPHNEISFNIQARNRLIYGESIKNNALYAENAEHDNGLTDLTLNIIEERSFLLNSNIDRFNARFEKGQLAIVLGRQRINWGLNYIWNPNDIFNVQNYFDFDYIEKPGSDALRIQYYTGEASNAEFVIKADHRKDITSAVYYRFNTLGYDIQFFGGLFESRDITAGAGFSGHIKGAGFNGEASYFHSTADSVDYGSMFLLSLGTDYMFSNSLYFQLEGLLQYSDSGSGIENFLQWYSTDLNVKKLSFSELSVYGGITYPFTPLFNGNLGIMYFPDISGFFAGPGLHFSLSENLDFSLISQIFRGELPGISDPAGKSNFFFGFIRLKYHF